MLHFANIGPADISSRTKYGTGSKKRGEIKPLCLSDISPRKKGRNLGMEGV